MSEELASTPGQPADAGEGTIQEENAGQEGVKGETLTRAEVAEMVAASEKRSISAAYTRIDQGEQRRINMVREAADSIAVIRASGKEITPAEEKEILDTATRKALTEPTTEPASQEQRDPVILDIQQAYGIELYQGDPELDDLDRTHGSMNWYKSIEVACKAKKERLSASPQPLPTPASRLPAEGGLTPQGIPEEMSANDAWKRVKHKT